MTASMCININEKRADMLQDTIHELRFYQTAMMNLTVTHVNFKFNNEDKSQSTISFQKNGNLKLQNSYSDSEFFLNAFSAFFFYNINEHLD